MALLLGGVEPFMQFYKRAPCGTFEICTSGSGDIVKRKSLRRTPDKDPSQ